MKKENKKILKGVLSIISFFVYNFILVLPLVILKIDPKEISRELFLVYTFIGNSIYLVIIFHLYKDKIINGYKKIFKDSDYYIRFGVKYWLIGLFLMVISNLLINTFSPNNIAANEEAVRNFVKIAPLFMLFSTVIFAPIIEETLFRKALYDVFIKPIDYLDKKYKCNTSDKFKLRYFLLISGLIFGGLHVASSVRNFYDILYIIPYGILGSTLAYIFYKTKNIAASISIHMLHNFIMVSLQIIALFLAK